MLKNKTIRKANSEDLIPIHLIEQDVFNHEQWTLEMIDSELKNFPGQSTWIIEESRLILGYCMTRMIFNETNILNMAIKSTHQGSGLGPYLFGYVLDQLPTKSSIYLEVKQGNLPALKLYHSFGFQVINSRRNYYKDGSTALVMHLEN